MGTHRPFPHPAPNRTAPAAGDDTATGPRRRGLVLMRPGWIRFRHVDETGAGDDPSSDGLDLGRAA